MFNEQHWNANGLREHLRPCGQTVNHNTGLYQRVIRRPSRYKDADHYENNSLNRHAIWSCGLKLLEKFYEILFGEILHKQRLKKFTMRQINV
jgi:hypothetical protein